MSFWTSDENYGQLLQLYSTATMLSRWGYEPYVIKYNGLSDTSAKRSVFRRLLSILANPKKVMMMIDRLRNTPSRFVEINKQREFSRFRENHFNWTRDYATISDLKADAPEFHAYITGSDMVWSAPILGDAYYLNFGPQETKRIAYAPSFGKSNIVKSYRKLLPGLLKHLDYISVREHSAKNIVEQYTQKPVLWVPDPTLLMNSEDFDRIASCKIGAGQEGKYVFTYLLGNSVDITMDQIDTFARGLGMDVKYTTAHERVDDYPKIYPTIEEWLELMSKAGFVFTNSFHGVAFAINFRKQFLYVPQTSLKGATNERALSLLQRLGLEDRVWKGDAEAVRNAIDYDKVFEKLNTWKESSVEYLQNALK